MADAGVLSPTEFAKRMLNKDERKESIRNIKENIKGSLNEIRHEVKDTVKVCYAYLPIQNYVIGKYFTDYYPYYYI